MTLVHQCPSLQFAWILRAVLVILLFLYQQLHLAALIFQMVHGCCMMDRGFSMRFKRVQ